MGKGPSTSRIPFKDGNLELERKGNYASILWHRESASFDWNGKRRPLVSAGRPRRSVSISYTGVEFAEYFAISRASNLSIMKLGNCCVNLITTEARSVFSAARVSFHVDAESVGFGALIDRLEMCTLPVSFMLQIKR